MASDRTPQDFAIEFAEYMAKGAEALITAVNADAQVRLRIAESDDVSDEDEHDAQSTVSEMQRALQSDIYEFRKRRDLAASATSPAPAGAGGPAEAGPLDQMAELSLLNRLIELGSEAAGAHATSNSDDGHKGTAAQAQWQELRAEMGGLIRVAYAAAPAAQGDADPIRQLIREHSEIIGHGEHYAYFELAYTRQTGWMAWLTDRPARGEPGTAEFAKSRSVITRGQGETAEEACQDALDVLTAARAQQAGNSNAK